MTDSDLSQISCLFEYLKDSPCHFTDIECICHHRETYASVGVCMSQKCTQVELLEVGRLQESVCHPEARDRKRDLCLTIILEVPALICLILRIYSRWLTAARYEVDDWIMMLTLPMMIVFITLGQMYWLGKTMVFGVDVWTLQDNNMITDALKVLTQLPNTVSNNGSLLT